MKRVLYQVFGRSLRERQRESVTDRAAAICTLISTLGCVLLEERSAERDFIARYSRYVVRRQIPALFPRQAEARVVSA